MSEDFVPQTGNSGAFHKLWSFDKKKIDIVTHNVYSNIMGSAMDESFSKGRGFLERYLERYLKEDKNVCKEQCSQYEKGITKMCFTLH